jgi:hypothetical protein
MGSQARKSLLTSVFILLPFSACTGAFTAPLHYKSHETRTIKREQGTERECKGMCAGGGHLDWQSRQVRLHVKVVGLSYRLLCNAQCLCKGADNLR